MDGYCDNLATWQKQKHLPKVGRQVFKILKSVEISV